MELVLCDLTQDIQEAVINLSRGTVDSRYKAEYDPQSMIVKIKLFSDSLAVKDLKKLILNNKFIGFSECENDEAITLEFIVR